MKNTLLDIYRWLGYKNVLLLSGIFLSINSAILLAWITKKFFVILLGIMVVTGLFLVLSHYFFQYIARMMLSKYYEEQHKRNLERVRYVRDSLRKPK